MIKLIESYRREVFKNLFNIDSFSKSWNNSWKSQVLKIFQNKDFSENQLLELGENLRSIFLSTSSGERKQGEVASAGSSWESLLAWYLNLGLIGTRTIVLKPKKDFNFESIKNTITVNYGEFISNSESDLIAITFPEDNKVAYSIEELKKYEGKVFSIKDLENLQDSSLKSLNSYLNRIIENNISKIEINVIQCKTNWNDNAQIPMGWDIIYSSTGFTKGDIKVGKDGFSIHKIKSFKYSFITVPTQKELDNFKESSTQVLRVKNLSGGNFWGVKTKENVAKSIGEIFKCNFKDSYLERNFNDRIKEINIEDIGL